MLSKDELQKAMADLEAGSKPAHPPGEILISLINQLAENHNDLSDKHNEFVAGVNDSTQKIAEWMSEQGRKTAQAHMTARIAMNVAGIAMQVALKEDHERMSDLVDRAIDLTRAEHDLVQVQVEEDRSEEVVEEFLTKMRASQ